MFTLDNIKNVCQTLSRGSHMKVYHMDQNLVIFKKIDKKEVTKMDKSNI